MEAERNDARWLWQKWATVSGLLQNQGMSCVSVGQDAVPDQKVVGPKSMIAKVMSLLRPLTPPQVPQGLPDPAFPEMHIAMDKSIR